MNHYFESLRYLSDRRESLKQFEQKMQEKGYAGPSGADDLASTMNALSLAHGRQGGARMSEQEYQRERAKFFAHQRELLRQRRTKLRLQQFHIITQVGQGGYGEVFLARKRDSGELCALKRLRKKVLIKMDEVRHVLTERDILTATRTPWLVRLLYAFQDEAHVYLAMVRGYAHTRNTCPAATSARCSTTAACCARSMHASTLPRCSSR